jgi:hypothetical protein
MNTTTHNSPARANRQPVPAQWKRVKGGGGEDGVHNTTTHNSPARAKRQPAPAQ